MNFDSIILIRMFVDLHFVLHWIYYICCMHVCTLLVFVHEIFIDFHEKSKFHTSICTDLLVQYQNTLTGLADPSDQQWRELILVCIWNCHSEGLKLLLTFLKIWISSQLKYSDTLMILYDQNCSHFPAPLITSKNIPW